MRFDAMWATENDEVYRQVLERAVATILDKQPGDSLSHATNLLQREMRQCPRAKWRSLRTDPAIRTLLFKLDGMKRPCIPQPAILGCEGAEKLKPVDGIEPRRLALLCGVKKKEEALYAVTLEEVATKWLSTVVDQSKVRECWLAAKELADEALLQPDLLISPGFLGDVTTRVLLAAGRDGKDQDERNKVCEALFTAMAESWLLRKEIPDCLFSRF